jgi:hypothetical protein
MTHSQIKYHDAQNSALEFMFRATSTNRISKPFKLDPKINFAIITAEILTHQNIFDKNLDNEGIE